MQIRNEPWSVTLAAIHFAAVMVVFALQSTDAQWQLGYLPFLLTDFPVSLVYRYLPPPLAEALIGTTWWFVMPLGIHYLWSAHLRRTQSGP